VASRRTITPAAEIMPDRCTPEYERTLAKMGALLPYRRARSLLEEFFPLGDAPEVETIRQRTMRVGARLERDAVAPPTSSPSSEAGSIALAIDGGHVKSVRSYQVRSFEVFVAQVSNDAGMRVMFSSVPAEADRQQQQLHGVLHRLGADRQRRTQHYDPPFFRRRFRPFESEAPPSGLWAKGGGGFVTSRFGIGAPPASSAPAFWVDCTSRRCTRQPICYAS
jgi:hypothetical protein